MTRIKNIASITSAAALALTIGACGSNSAPSSPATPTPAQTSAPAPAQGSAAAAPTGTAIPPTDSNMSVSELCNVALAQDSALYKILGPSPDTTSAANAISTLGQDFDQDAIANAYASGDSGLNADLTQFGADATILSTTLSSGLPASDAYTALANDANGLDQDCGYSAGTF